MTNVKILSFRVMTKLSRVTSKIISLLIILFCFVLSFFFFNFVCLFVFVLFLFCKRNRVRSVRLRKVTR